MLTENHIRIFRSQSFLSGRAASHEANHPQHSLEIQNNLKLDWLIAARALLSIPLYTGDIVTRPPLQAYIEFDVSSTYRHCAEVCSHEIS